MHLLGRSVRVNEVRKVWWHGGFESKEKEFIIDGPDQEPVKADEGRGDVLPGPSTGENPDFWKQQSV